MSVLLPNVRKISAAVLFAGAAIVGLTAESSNANAITLNTTVTIKIYQGTGPDCGGPCINDTSQQAQQGNPLIDAGNLLGTGTFTVI